MPLIVSSTTDPPVLSHLSFLQAISDDILISIFSFLPAFSLLRSSETCTTWHRVAQDEFLWKSLFYHNWNVSWSIPMMHGKTSWLSEYKRLQFHIPSIESEVICAHSDQVLHVSASHNGELFATCSKDGFIRIWDSTSYPTTLKYESNMKEFSWKYTQFSQFNDTDTLILVSGVHFGANSTSGEIAVFNLQDEFELQCRVINKPYDVFGAWYNDSYLLSGNLYPTAYLQNAAGLWLNKASQASESEQESVVMLLFRFMNVNASSIRSIMVANCPPSSTVDKTCKSRPSVNKHHKHEDIHSAKCSNKPVSTGDGKTVKSTKKLQSIRVYENGAYRNKQFAVAEKSENDEEMIAPIEYESEYRFAEGASNKEAQGNCARLCHCHIKDRENHSHDFIQDSDMETSNVKSCQCNCDTPDDNVKTCSWYRDKEFCHGNNGCSSCRQGHRAPSETSESEYKYLIFTTGSKAYTPHQVGIKRIKSLKAAQNIDLQTSQHGVRLLPDIADNVHMLNRNDYDTVDSLIDLHGHIIGLCLSPDHRYLYVNSRSWPDNYHIENPLYPPPIAQEIDIHVIDVHQMKSVGTMHRSHRAFTPNDECFFIFLDVCDEYVASGAEDRHAYIWDRHYGICLNRLPHNDVVNCVAFNRKNSEMLMSVSDDFKIKIWRSRNLEQQLLCKSSVVNEKTKASS